MASEEWVMAYEALLCRWHWTHHDHTRRRAEKLGINKHHTSVQEGEVNHSVSTVFELLVGF